jgi:AcrR family transcriptional regulator
MQNRRDGKETRADILKAALHLFGEYGFHKTSISMVADKANVYRSAIAFYYGSKTDLLLGVWEHYIENHLLSLIQELSFEMDNGNHHNVLRKMISLWTDNFKADPEQMRATLRLLLDGPQSMPVLAKQAQSLFHNAHQLMEQLIARGQLNRTIIGRSTQLDGQPADGWRFWAFSRMLLVPGHLHAGKNDRGSTHAVRGLFYGAGHAGDR